ncbi:LamB/YcsF family protein [Tenacibaculum agarivorans]|uniref:LamB/YcsF family protein n=1 Tax=Tenacibaculum agarivorans TaxID=1908389 RepID=UPI00094BBEC3|nr:LamB/YcsF family protein [Tenacibaculum agarivorans]
MSFNRVDINCDLGEGLNNEEMLMPYLNSCNIACGGHAGTVDSIDSVLDLTEKYKVKVGAHPSFPDRENFGRKKIEISSEDLSNSLITQLTVIQERAELKNISIHHVKAHGALYNLAASETYYADIVIEAITKVFPKKSVCIYVPYQSVIAKKAFQANLEVKYEAFIDRRYNNDLSLVSRTLPNAVITDVNLAWNQLKKMLTEDKVTSVQNDEVEIKADTFCVHGDHENAEVLLQFLNEKLNA